MGHIRGNVWQNAHKDHGLADVATADSKMNPGYCKCSRV